MFLVSTSQRFIVSLNLADWNWPLWTHFIAVETQPPSELKYLQPNQGAVNLRFSRSLGDLGSLGGCPDFLPAEGSFEADS